MKIVLYLVVSAICVTSCESKGKGSIPEKETMISLRSDTLNTVKMADSLIIYESTCRGCAYESSTHFDIGDSLGIIKLAAIKTIDNNSPDMSGGNVSKHLILVPVKPGKTTIKLYKFWKEQTTAEDSARFVPYTIEVRN